MISPSETRAKWTSRSPAGSRRYIPVRRLIGHPSCPDRAVLRIRRRVKTSHVRAMRAPAGRRTIHANDDSASPGSRPRTRTMIPRCFAAADRSSRDALANGVSAAGNPSESLRANARAPIRNRAGVITLPRLSVGPHLRRTWSGCSRGFAKATAARWNNVHTGERSSK
jgi:hypothetical protein